MNDLSVSKNIFTPKGYYTKPWKGLENFQSETINSMCAIFDQNGYKLTDIEQLFCNDNFPGLASKYRLNYDEVSCFYDWIRQPPKRQRAVLNHSWLFQRKGFKLDAEKQLKKLAQKNPILFKVLRIRPKWGLDFSIDWFDRQGNVFEVVHWEWDSFNFLEIEEERKKAEKVILDIDWDNVGQKLLNKKSEWWDLPFKQQSDYKCAYVGLKSERFNDVIWE